MSDDAGRSAAGPALLRKILLSVVTGFVTFAGSELLEGALDVTLAEQLILTAVVGGVTLLTQFLIDFGQRLEQLELATARQLDVLAQQQRRNISEARAVVDRGFERISDATMFFKLLESSALHTEALTRLMHHSSLINATGPALARDLAHLEIERTSGLLKSLSGGEEVFYDGEDREYLLGLARSARRSIVATSLLTVDAGVKSFEGGLWLNDLGARYVDLQRDATYRGVTIRRVFVFDAWAFADDPSFVRVRRLQRQAGVHIRALTEDLVPEHLQDHIADFIVFDGEVGYETTRASKMRKDVQPAILTTRVVLDPDRVRRSAVRFDELWDAAVEFDDAPAPPASSDPPSDRIDLAAAGEDVADPLEDVER